MRQKTGSEVLSGNKGDSRLKKVLILGAGTYQVDLIKKCKELGHEAIVVSPGDYPGMKYADKVIDANIMDHEAVLEIARREKVDGIISDQTDMAVYSIAYATKALGLPGNDPEVADLFINKHLMREKCEELGLPSIPSASAATLQEAEQYFNEFGAPCIIKPIDSAGSKGVTRINNVAELREYYLECASYSGNGEIIIEKFIVGKEFEVDSIALNGRVKTLMYADLNEFKIPNVFASMTRLYPSVADKEIVDKLLAYDLKMLNGFGLKQGLTHGEYIVEDGTNEVYLIETALRGGGTFISSHIAELQTGVNTAEFLIRMALGELRDIPEFRSGLCHCGYVAFYLPAGEIVSVEGVDEVMNLDYVRKTTLENIRTGTRTKEFHDKRNRHAVILSGSSREELNQRIGEIRRLLKIQVMTDSGVKGPIWE